MRVMPHELSAWVSTALSRGAQKLGQPVPLSNLVVDEKASKLQPAQANTAFPLFMQKGAREGPLGPILAQDRILIRRRSFSASRRRCGRHGRPGRARPGVAKRFALAIAAKPLRAVRPVGRFPVHLMVLAGLGITLASNAIRWKENTLGCLDLFEPSGPSVLATRRDGTARFRSRLCENAAKFYGWPSRAKFFAVFLILNVLRARKSEQNRSV